MPTTMRHLFLAGALLTMMFVSGCAATGYYSGYDGYYDEPGGSYYYGPDVYGGAPRGYYRFDIHPGNRYWDRDHGSWRRHERNDWREHRDHGRGHGEHERGDD